MIDTLKIIGWVLLGWLTLGTICLAYIIRLWLREEAAWDMSEQSDYDRQFLAQHGIEALDARDA